MAVSISTSVCRNIDSRRELSIFSYHHLLEYFKTHNFSDALNEMFNYSFERETESLYPCGYIHSEK